MLSLQISASEDVFEKWNELPQRFKTALAAKMRAFTKALEDKVITNLSGLVLEVKTGQLRGSIKSEIHSGQYEFIAFVGPEPATPKAWAQEFGGKSAYPIVPTKARMLHFFLKSGDEVFTKFVLHPPLPERSYLRSALDEMMNVIDMDLSAIPSELS